MQPRSKQIKPSICKGFWSITCLLPQVLHKHNFYQATRPRRFFSSDLEVSVWSAEICLQAEERVWWFLTAFGTNTPQQPVKPQHQVFSKPNDSWKLASAFDLSEMFFKPCRRCCRCWLCPSKVSVVPLGPPGLQPCWLLPALSCVHGHLSCAGRALQKHFGIALLATGGAGSEMLLNDHCEQNAVILDIQGWWSASTSHSKFQTAKFVCQRSAKNAAF